jgi:cytochrome d ubiquinol oxidase subunit II
MYGILALRFHLARACVVLQVTLIFWGWALSQYPYLIVPSTTIAGAAAPPHVLRLLITAVAVGGLLLLPSFFYLLKVFKGQKGITGRQAR